MKKKLLSLLLTVFCMTSAFGLFACDLLGGGSSAESGTSAVSEGSESDLATDSESDTDSDSDSDSDGDETEGEQRLLFELSEDETYYIVSGYEETTKNLVIPSEHEEKPVKEIKEFAFSRNQTVESISIPSSVKKIGRNAFMYCEKMTDLTLSEGLEEIGDKAFFNCSLLTEAVIPNSVTTMGEGVFFYTKLTDVVIGTGLDYIPKESFVCCEFESFTVPTHIKRIEQGAFESCEELRSVTFHSEVTEIGARAFINTGIERLQLPQGVTTLEEEVFQLCKKLVEVEFLGAVTGRMGTKAFSGCESLTSFEIPAGITTIGESAFAFSGLESISIPNGVQKLEASAFTECKELKTVSIGTGVTEMGKNVFAYATKLESISVASANPAYKSASDALFSKDGKTLVAYPIGNAATTFSLTGVTTICEGAFGLSRTLTTLTIPSSVTCIEQYAFNQAHMEDGIIFEVREGWKYGEEEILASELESANNARFILCASGAAGSKGDKTWTRESSGGAGGAALPSDWNSDNIEYRESDDGSYYIVTSGYNASGNVKIPAEYNGKPVKSIGDGAFSGVEGITAISIPGTVETMGGKAFMYCVDLEIVVLEEGVTMVGEGAFADCIKLKIIIMPSTLKIIGGSAFERCFALEELVLGSGVEMIALYAFTYCEGLQRVTVPASVRHIEYGAFHGCIALQSVTFEDATDWKHIDTDVSALFTSPTNAAAYILQYSFDDFVKIADGTGDGGDEGTEIPGGSGGDEGTEIPGGSGGDEGTEIPGGSGGGDGTEFPGGGEESSGGSGGAAIPTDWNSDGLNFELAEDEYGEYYILINSPTASGNVIIPAEYNGKPVREMSEDAFAVNEFITALYFPGTIEEISAKSCSNCFNLEVVVLEEGVKYIGGGAFIQCERLSTVVLPSTIRSIGDNAFYYCPMLQSITLNAGLEKIETMAFSGCTNLASITIPSSVYYIGDSAFAYSGLTSIIFEDNTNWKCCGADVTEQLATPSGAATYLLNEYYGIIKVDE